MVCDICQISCPYNRGIDNPLASDIDPELAMPELLPFLELTNKSFRGEIWDDCRFMAREEYSST